MSNSINLLMKVDLSVMNYSFTSEPLARLICSLY
jgi:hypothetical protein